METLTRIFGAKVAIFFTTSGGVSLSEVARIQAENKEQNDKFWAMVSDAHAGVFHKTLTFLGNGAPSRPLHGSRITVEDIESSYAAVATRNAQSAVLMSALKMHKSVQQQLECMDLEYLVTDAPLEAPPRPASAKSGTTCRTELFMGLSNIDEMVDNLEEPLLQQFEFAFYARANELNSKAAAIGKLISAQGAFFRELTRPLPKGSEQVTQSGVLLTEWEREYAPEELDRFATAREALRLEYEDLQRQLNGCRKQMKDAVRAYNLEEKRAYQVRLGVYRLAAEQHAHEAEHVRSAAETLRQQAQVELAALRIRER